MANRNTTRLSSKYQISIPESVRKAQQWKAGQLFAFLLKGEGILLVPVPEADELVGMFPGAEPGEYRDRNDRT